MSSTTPARRQSKGLIVAAGLGLAGLGLVAATTPFLLPALRRHCLPYVPATEEQLKNLRIAFNSYSSKGDKFLDIGSGDGRICRLAASTNLYSNVHGVELNNLLVLYSRLVSFKSDRSNRIKYFHKDLWKFPVQEYESVCIFGVESMMEPLRDYLVKTNRGRQVLFACRFPFKDMDQIGEIGQGIDTVWVYQTDARGVGR